MELGFRTITTLYTVTRCVPETLTKKQPILNQLVSSCLNTCLDRLNGTKMNQLKMGKNAKGGTVKDFALYGFYPEKLTTLVMEMYVYIRRADKEKVLKEILADERSFSPNTFQRALNAARKYGFLRGELLTEFEELLKELKERGENGGGAMEIEIPDEYADPIMGTVMDDPVLLPGSQMVMDRGVIERHLMSSDDDPFSRVKLTVAQLIPQPELKAKIEEWKKIHNML